MEHTFLIDNCVLVLERKKIKFKKKRKQFLTNPIFYLIRFAPMMIAFNSKSIRFAWVESNRIELFAYSVRFRPLLDNKDFIVIDHHNPRYLTFGTLQSLENLCSSDHILLDSTFKSCASPFVHLYTIHAQSSILNGTVPILILFITK